MQAKVREWLETGKIDLFLGYKMVAGHPLPYAFSLADLGEVSELIAGPARYALEKMAHEIVTAKPELKVGIMARDCNRRALNVLLVHQQVAPGQVMVLDVNCCPSPLREHADCSALETKTIGFYKKEVGIDNNLSVENAEIFEQPERFARWMYEFQKCLKCYGCRDICPVCFCRECSLEHEDLIGTGELPPEVPIFHLVRAVHMAGRCIDCGLCEDACPADIPLRLLYRKVNDIIAKEFDYKTGLSLEQPPFSLLFDRSSKAAEASHEG
jgi:ferredoxin